MSVKARLGKLESTAKANGGVLVLKLYPGDDEKALVAAWEAENGRKRPDLVVFIRKFSERSQEYSLEGNNDAENADREAGSPQALGSNQPGTNAAKGEP